MMGELLVTKSNIYLREGRIHSLHAREFENAGLEAMFVERKLHAFANCCIVQSVLAIGKRAAFTALTIGGGTSNVGQT